MLGKKKILVIGDVMLDHYITGDVERISPEAPVPVLSNVKDFYRAGGAANVAMNVVGLGSECILIGIIGDDEAGKILRGLVSDDMASAHNTKTTVKTRVLAGTQQLCRIDIDGQHAPLGLSIFHDAKNVNLFEWADAVILSDYAKGALSFGVCREVILQCKERNIPVLVDPKCKDFSKYRGATVVTPNRKEIVGNIDQNALDIANLIVTNGEHGITGYSNNGSATYHSPAKAKEVFDVSGAGDTVIATLAVCIANDLKLSYAIDLANATAGIVVGKLGTYAITPEDMQELEIANSPKIMSIASLDIAAGWWRNKGHKLVFTNGCFDMLHPGHIALLKEAKTFGTKLIVAINSDAAVRALKGDSRPFINQVDRANMLAALDCVDAVIVFEDEQDLFNLINTIRADVLVKGKDYIDKHIVGASLAREVKYVDMVEGYSTTEMQKKMVLTQ